MGRHLFVHVTRLGWPEHMLGVWRGTEINRVSRQMEVALTPYMKDAHHAKPNRHQNRYQTKRYQTSAYEMIATDFYILAPI